MKYIKRINESKEDESEQVFKYAITKGHTSVKVEYLGNDWKKVSDKYYLYDNFYYYEDKILQLVERESGDWYYYELEVLKVHPLEFKNKIFERINKLEEAFGKITT